ncbi:hypothetical protein C9374_006112 [Naegleria lovaniensis]|uniref:PH domain-containing protein n=1 Tax=Naegleria lovaniensis TaxID=51637 RepID=A0AA88GNC8_NAELO|nr:uncharacterized protein C9374_006112 [Naegleria lovaniensis]KAG2381728.1 hypothetical protein C9374_006112 [Naegleria lovaniensis]
MQSQFRNNHQGHNIVANSSSTIRNRRNSLNQNKTATNNNNRKASDDIADFKERLLRYQGIVLDEQQPTSSKEVTVQSSLTTETSRPTAKEALIKEAQQLLTEDSIIISPSKSFLYNTSKIFDDSMLLDDTEINEKPSHQPKESPTIADNSTSRVQDQKSSTTPKSLNQTTSSMTPIKLVSPRIVDTIMAQPERNPLEVERQKLVDERLEDVQAQISKLEKAISILDHKEMEVKNEKREQCEAIKNVIKDASSKLDATFSKIGALQKKQDNDLNFLSKEQKQLKEVLHQIDTKRFKMMKELEGYTKSHKDTTFTDFDHLFTERQQNLQEIEQQLNGALHEQETLLKELEDMEIEEQVWLGQIAENAAILVGSALTEEQQQNLLTLVKREKEISLRVERLKEKYPHEILLIDLKYTFKKSVDSLTQAKEEAERRRLEVCQRIESKRVELEELEAENMKMKNKYTENKENLLSVSRSESEKIKILDQFTSSLRKEVSESSAVLERAKGLREEEMDLKAFSNVVNMFNAEVLSLLSKEQSGDTGEVSKEMKSLVQNALLVNASEDLTEDANNEQDLADLKKQEFERLNLFSNMVSDLEQAIGSLVKERTECDQEIDRCITELQELEESLLKNKETAEKQIADQLKPYSGDDLKQREEVFARCEMFVTSLNQIKDVVDKISRKCSCESVNNFLEACNNVESQLRQILQRKNEKSNLLRECLERVESLQHSKKICEEKMEKLLTQHRKQQNEKAKKQVQIESRRAELEQLIASLEEERKNKVVEVDSVCKPIDVSITKLEQEIHELTLVAQSQKKALNSLKRELEEVEAVFTGKVSQIRAQRQHLKHRLDLKLQAVENVKKSGAEIIMRSIKPSKSKENKLNNSTSCSYYNMYMKKKDPNIFNDTPIEDEIFRALEEESKEHEQQTTNEVLSTEEHLLNNHDSCEDPVKEDHHYSSEVKYLSSNVDTTATDEETIQSQPTTPSTFKSSTLPLPTVYPSSLPKTTHVKQQDLFVTKRSSFKLFGPNSKALGRDDIQFILEKFQFMCNGSLLHKKKSNNEFVLRHVCLSQEFTRLLIRDNKKKVPESFIKVEHIQSVVGNKDQHVKNLDGAFTFVMKTDTKKHEFLTFDELDAMNWIEGLNLLIDNKQNLFSLKYNIRDLFNNN